MSIEAPRLESMMVAGLKELLETGMDVNDPLLDVAVEGVNMGCPWLDVVVEAVVLLVEEVSWVV